MDILKSKDDYYVKFEMFFEEYTPSILMAHFTCHIFNAKVEYEVYSEESGMISRSEYETELASAIFDALLIDQYINPEKGLLEEIGANATNISLVFREFEQDDLPELHKNTRVELESLLKKVVSEFLDSKVAIAT